MSLNGQVALSDGSKRQIDPIDIRPRAQACGDDAGMLPRQARDAQADLQPVAVLHGMHFGQRITVYADQVEQPAPASTRKSNSVWCWASSSRRLQTAARSCFALLDWLLKD